MNNNREIIKAWNVILEQESLPDDQRQKLRDMRNKKIENFIKANHKLSISYLANQKRWRAIVGQGKERQQVWGKTKEELYSKLYKKYIELEKPSYTIKQVFELSQEQALMKGNKPNTIERKRQDYERFSTPDFDDMLVKDTDEEYLEGYINKMVHELHPKEHALDNFIGVLNQIFQTAEKRKVIERNPMRYISAKQYYKYCDTSSKSANEEIFSMEDMERLKSWYADNHRWLYDPQASAVQFCFLTGVRVGEIPPLKWSDVADGESIHIHCQQTEERKKGEHVHFEIVDYTKNERMHPNGGRKFPIYDELASLLKQIKAEQVEAGISSEYIFSDKDGKPITKASIDKFFRYRQKKLGYSITNIHAIRKSFNSNVLRYTRLQEQDIAYILGHSIRTNREAYTFVHEERLGEVRNALNSFEHS